MTKTVAYSQIGDVRKILDRLVKKSNKHGIGFGYSVSESTYYKTVNVYDADSHTVNSHASQTYQVEVVDIELSDTVICANGWTVTAHIEHTDGGHNVVTPIASIENIPAEWYTIIGNCDHCNSNRSRLKTYIVERNGEYKQVGTTCLKDYTGIHPELAIMWAQVQEMVINNIMGGNSLYEMFGGSIPSAYKVVEVVALAIDSIKEFGYCKADSQNPTKERVLKMFNDSIAPTPESMIQASTVCEFAINYNGTYSGIGDIILNAKAVIMSEYCKYKHFGRLVYLPIAIEREIERTAKLEARAIESAKSNYIGTVGERISVEVSSAKLISSFSTEYGVTRVYRFTDATDNVITWFSSKGIDIDNMKILTGTIKDHSEYNGEKQTIMTRCKIS